MTDPDSMTEGLSESTAVYPSILCERYARQVYIHLRAGRFKEAESVIIAARYDLQSTGEPAYLHLDDIGIAGNTAEAMRAAFNVSTLGDLEGITPDMIHKRTNISRHSVALMIDGCARVGFPWPANGE